MGDIFAKYTEQDIANEDCWWWQDPDGSYHMLSHRMTQSERRGRISGGHGFTRNLTNWSYALTPAYDTDVLLTNGSNLTFKARERPQLLFGADGKPAVLYNAMMAHTGLPFTFAQAFAGNSQG